MKNDILKFSEELFFCFVLNQVFDGHLFFGQTGDWQRLEFLAFFFENFFFSGKKKIQTKFFQFSRNKMKKIPKVFSFKNCVFQIFFDHDKKCSNREKNLNLSEKNSFFSLETGEKKKVEFFFFFKSKKNLNKRFF